MLRDDLIEVDFKLAGNSARFTGSGWSDQEGGGRWAIGRECHLTLPGVRLETGCVLEFAVTPYVMEDTLRAQRLIIDVNGHEMYAAQHSSRSMVTIPIPNETVIGGPVDLEIVIRQPDATKPASLGASGDARELGFYFRALTVKRANAANCVSTPAAAVDAASVRVAEVKSAETGAPHPASRGANTKAAPKSSGWLSFLGW